MTPIFKNVDVSLDDVGEVMQNYAKEHSIKDVPRRLLIGSYFGKENRLSTPLLKWYLEHGLVVTCIYKVIEYIRNAAFNSFMTQVAQARLDGDRDKNKALITETMKRIGNSSSGKLITNKEKHHDIVYINESEIGAEIMDNYFYSLTELPNGYYEVEKRNRKLFSIFLFTSVSSSQTMPNSVCSSSTMIVSINTFPVRTLSTVIMRWTLTRHIWQSLETVVNN